MLLNEVHTAQRSLLDYDIEDVVLRVTHPVTLGVLQDAETRIGRGLPAALKHVFLQEAGGLNFRWNTDAFGLACNCGHAWLLSPGEIVDAFKMHFAVAEDMMRDGLDRTS